MALGNVQIKALEQSARHFTGSASVSLWVQAILELCSQSSVIEQGSSINEGVFTQECCAGKHQSNMHRAYKVEGDH